MSGRRCFGCTCRRRENRAGVCPQGRGCGGGEFRGSWDENVRRQSAGRRLWSVGCREGGGRGERGRRGGGDGSQHGCRGVQEHGVGGEARWGWRCRRGGVRLGLRAGSIGGLL